MAYTPVNLQGYTAAFAGAIAGMAVNGWITSPNGANYTDACTIAGAFAQAFDVAWNSATALNGLEYSAIQQVCSQEFAQRGPGPLNAPQFADPANWAVPAKACATLALQADLFFAGQGITPPPFGSSSLFAATGLNAVLATPGSNQNIDIAIGAIPAGLTKVLTMAVLSCDTVDLFEVVTGISTLISWDGGTTFVDSSPTFGVQVTGVDNPPAVDSGAGTHVQVPVNFLGVSGPGTRDVIVRVTAGVTAENPGNITLVANVTALFLP